VGNGTTRKRRKSEKESLRSVCVPRKKKQPPRKSERKASIIEAK
jgi:hypothetical protein